MQNPSKPDCFVGKANTIARVLFHKIPSLKADGLSVMSRRYLFTGAAGVGKSSLAMAVASAITGNSIASILARNSTNVEWLNGQSATVDVFRKWTEQGHYLPMYGDRIVQIVDEVDSMSIAAHNEACSYLDALPPFVVFFATSNKSVEELPERLQSRFQVWKFPAVPTDIITTLLMSQFPTLTNHSEIAGGAKGNVRSAITDALQHLEVQEAMA